MAVRRPKLRLRSANRLFPSSDPVTWQSKRTTEPTSSCSVILRSLKEHAQKFRTQRVRHLSRDLSGKGSAAAPKTHRAFTVDVRVLGRLLRPRHNRSTSSSSRSWFRSPAITVHFSVRVKRTWPRSERPWLASTAIEPASGTTIEKFVPLEDPLRGGPAGASATRLDSIDTYEIGKL